MRLVYTATGIEVKVGDKVTSAAGQNFEVVSFRTPRSAASSGHVEVRGMTSRGRPKPKLRTQEFYVGVIGAQWIEREDRPSDGAASSAVKLHSVDVLTQATEVRIALHNLDVAAETLAAECELGKSNEMAELAGEIMDAVRTAYSKMGAASVKADRLKRLAHDEPA